MLKARGLAIGVLVAVRLGVLVAVRLGVLVAVRVDVLITVRVDVLVAVRVDVLVAVRVNVGVVVISMILRLTASSTLIRGSCKPLRESVMVVPVAKSHCKIWPTDALGATCFIIAQAPATCGVAMDVPAL